MADTTRKKTSSFDQTTVAKDKDTEKGTEKAEKTIQSKQAVKSPKPPLPPRPVGLSKIPPGKKKASPLSKPPQHTKETHKKVGQNEESSSPKPKRPPCPSNQAGIKTPENAGKARVVEEAKTNEIGKISASKKPTLPGQDSKDRSIHQEHPVSPPHTLPQVPDTTGISETEDISPVTERTSQLGETKCVSTQSQDPTEGRKPTNTEHIESTRVEITQELPPENIPEQKISVERKTAKPTRPENPKTYFIESDAHHVTTGHRPSEILNSPSAAMFATFETGENTGGRETFSKIDETHPQTPERPKPPTRSPSVATDDQSSKMDSGTKASQNSASSAKLTPPRVPRTPKITPPIPPKPGSPHGERKSKSDKPLKVLGKQSPPVQPRSPKSKPPARPKIPEAVRASDIGKENDVEKSGSFVETDSEETTSYPVENTSSSTDATVVAQTTEDISSTPENNDVVNEEVEPSKNTSNVSILPEKHPELATISHEGTPDNVVSPKPEKTSETIEKRVDSDIHPRKEGKPSRPRAPSKTKTEKDEKISHDNSTSPDSLPIKPSRPQDQQSCNVVTNDVQISHENSKSEKMTSPKPSRPTKPRIPPELPKTMKDVETNVSQETNEHYNKSVKHKNVDKPQRPSKPKDPKRPAESVIVTESDSSTQVNARGGERHQNTAIIYHEPQKNKPQRPSKPKLHTESAKESDCSYKNNVQEDDRHKNSVIIDHEPQTAAAKPQRPIKPKLSSELTTAEELEISKDDEEEVFQHKNGVSNKPCRPTKPNSEMTTAHKEEKQTNKHDSESESNHSVKRTVAIKPSRLTKLSGSTHDIATHQTFLSSVHTTEVIKHRPPRPHAPHHEKQISVETVETPPKPKRTSISENNELGMEQSRLLKKESISEQPADSTGETKLVEKPAKPAHITEESKECLNEISSGEPEKTRIELQSSEVKRNDAESEVNIVSVASERNEETDKQDKPASSEHSKSFKLARPPPPSRTNSVQKDEPETQTPETDKSNDRRSVRFRVSSLSKTEVESFNKKDFLEKLKEKGRTRRNSEEDSASVPQINPKPSRPRPPSSDKSIGTSGEHGNETPEVTGSEEVVDRLGNEKEYKTTDITSSTTDKAGELSHENISETTSSRNEKADESKYENNAVTSSLTNKTSRRENENISKKIETPERKGKRKAPPVPDEQHEHLKKEIVEGVKHEQKVLDEKKSKEGERANEPLEMNKNLKTKRNVDKNEIENAEGQVVLDVETKTETPSASEQPSVHSAESNLKDSTPEDLTGSSEPIEQSADKDNVENNNVIIQDPAVAMDSTHKHQVIAKDNDGCVETSVVEHTIMDKEQPVVTQVLEISASGENAYELTSSDLNVKKRQVCENTSISPEVTQASRENTQSPCNQSSDQDGQEDVDVGKTNAVIQSPKKRKTPPLKPKRTSSLKRDSKLIVPKRGATEEAEDSINELNKPSSPDGLNKITEDNEAGKPRGTTEVVSIQTNEISKDSHVTSTKAVKFTENIPEEKRPSKPVSRSKSFAPPGKDRGKKISSKDTSDPGGDGISRSLSFGGKMKKKHQPPRPSPPTFFLGETNTDESADHETVSEEPRKDDVINKVEDTSTSQEDLVELETSKNDRKHESVLTTDSESENEKEDEPQKSKTYYISREILSTERSFVDVVKLVSEDFREAVKKGNEKFGRAIIPDETLQDIVLNISQIYKFDSEFLKALEGRMETWEEEQRIGDIIKKFSPFLKMYKTYIQGYDNAMAVLTEALKKYPQFAEVVREFKCSERCQNLTVGMYMLKPIQRIPSYRLLLIDYLKHLSKDSLDHKDVSDALAIVSEVATHINEDMKRVDNFEEVLKVQRSLVGQVEIVKPGRELLKEGALMKLSRKEMQPRMFYLLTDVLLYTTPVANNQYRLNLSLPLEEITVELPVSPDFENEFSIITTKKSFILSASTAEERDEWLEALRNASDEIRKKKITFHLAKKEKMEALYDARQQDEDKMAKLGSKAPVWIPDIRVTMCMVCTDDFTVTNRRHHCRACGKVICGSCSSNSAPLAYLNYETARVCDVCYDELTDTTSTAQTTVETKENGVQASERKDSAPKINPLKKSRKRNLFKSKEVPAVEESTISGYLKTRVGKKWHKRWYVVKDNVLYASKASSDPAAQETRPLLGYDVRGPEKMDGDSKKIVFQLIHAGTEPVVLQTDNMKHGEQWVNALRRATILPH